MLQKPDSAHMKKAQEKNPTLTSIITELRILFRPPRNREEMALRSLRRTVLRALSPLRSSFSSIPATKNTSPFSLSSYSAEPSTSNFSYNIISYRRFSSLTEEEPHGPAKIDFSSLMPEDEYHKLANSTIHDLLEKLEEYGDCVDIDGFDVDYGNEVLTLKLGDSGTYVINKQTPNRQIWMSSPVSGPSRFDWDQKAKSWIYRRTKQNLFKVLETELEKLCEKPIALS